MKLSRLVLALVLLFTVSCGPGSEEGPRQPQPMMPGLEPTQGMLDDAARDLHQIRDGFLEWYFEAHPVRASELGMHQHDSRLPAMTRTGVQERIDDLLDWLADLEAVRFDFMRGDDRYDYAVLEYGIREELLGLEESREWANDPRVYTALIARGLASVASWDYAPFADRAESLRARMAEAPSLLEAARQNLRSPPRLWTDMAIADARGLLQYLENDLPEQLEAGSGGALPPGLDDARVALVDAVESHVGWLESELLPRATGSYSLGRFLLERKLRYSEHISLSIEELERLNRESIAEYQQELEAVAGEIDPERTPQAILDSINGLYPEPAALLDTARSMVTAARTWTEGSGLVMVPPAESPTVRDSPPYARDVFTSLKTPGPFETESLGAYFNLTNAAADWDEALVRQHMSHFSHAGLMVTTLHETYPGLYVQQLYERDVSDLRRLFVPRSVREGWAHYAAGLAVAQGFSDDPAIRIVELQRALQRQARWYAVIHLHAMGESIDDVVARFMEIAHVPEFPARREVVHATRDPLYLADGLGRMQIQELRDDYQAFMDEKEDETFSLQTFHERLLRLGLPFPLAREALMPREQVRDDR